MKHIVCLLLCALLLFTSLAALGETAAKPAPTESEIQQLQRMLRNVRDESLWMMTFDPPLSGKLFIARFGEDDKLDGTSMAAAASGEDYYGIPARYLALTLDEAETVILFYRNLKTVGRYGNNGPSAKSTATRVGIVDRKRNVMYRSFTAATEAPPMAYSGAGSRTTGSFMPGKAGEKIAEMLSERAPREPFAADLAAIDALMDKRLNGRLKAREAEPKLNGKIVVAVYTEAGACAMTTLEYAAAGRDFYGYPASRLAKTLKEARTLVLVYPTYSEYGHIIGGGTAYRSKTMITVIDMKNQKQCVDKVYSSDFPPSRVNSKSSDYHSSYSWEYALNWIAKKLGK